MRRDKVFIKKKESNEIRIAKKTKKDMTVQNPIPELRKDDLFRCLVIKLILDGRNIEEVSKMLCCPKWYIAEIVEVCVYGKTRGSYWYPTSYHRIWS